jgi:AcrR family transcriptional regulator
MRGVSQGVNRRGVATRQALLDAAIELWSVTGWRGTGIIPVAERAGVTNATLLHHFGTKDNFLLQVLAELDRRTVAYWERQGVVGIEYIRRVLTEAGDQPDHPGLWKLHLKLETENLDPGGPAYDYYVLRHRYVHDAFADAVRAGQASGDIRPRADPDLVAAQILAFMNGMWLHVSHGPKDIPAADVFQDFTNRLIRHLTDPT